MNESIFHTIISGAGCKLETEDSQITLVGDPANFRREITLKLRSHPEYPAPAVDKFLEELQVHLDDLANLRSCLLPLSVSGGSSLKIGSSMADSLIRILLSIDILQPILIDNLLERLPGFITDSEAETVDSPIPRLILQQLRWLDHIVAPERLTEKIIEMIQITPISIQHEIITSLPEIINDTEHKSIVAQLKDLIAQNHELVVPTLDALTNLNLNLDNIEDIRETVIDRLESVNLDELPVLVKFLLQSVTPETIPKVIANIRHKLDFRSIGRLQQDQKALGMSQKSGRHIKKERMPEALLFDAIEVGIRFHKFVCDAWIKAITEVQRPERHKVVDVLVLFILHSMTHMKKKVEAIFRKKIIAGLFTHQLLMEAIKYHSEGLREYFNTVLSLSESLLRSSQQRAVIARCASTLYSSAFGVFDAYHRQEIVGSLVTHIGSGAISFYTIVQASYPTEIDSALSVLLDLVRQDPASMSRYAVFVKGILDYLDNLSMDQIRILFEIFSVLAFESEVHGEASGGNLLSDILIVIRKQLSNPMERYKKIGVIGGLAIVKQMGSQEEGASAPGSSQYDPEILATQALRNPFLRQAITILEMIRHSCAKSFSCLSIAYDELAYLVSNRVLDPRLEVWIKDHIAEDFTVIYVIFKDDLIEDQLKGMPIQTWMDLEDPEDPKKPNVRVNIYPCLCAPIQSSDTIQQRDRILSLCSLFKLMQACLKASSNGSQSLFVLLECGLAMYEKVEVSHMKSIYTVAMREAACNSLFFAINWFRELLNAFSDQNDDETAGIILLRLRHLGTLEATLQELLECTPSFRPWGSFQSNTPPENKENGGIIRRPASTKILKGGGNTARRSALNGRKVINSTRMLSDDDESAAGRNVNVANGIPPKFTDVADLRPYMRELELDVLTILSYGEIQCQPSDTNLQEKDVTDTGSSGTVKLRYPELRYLLQDLNRKLDHKFGPFAITHFAKKKELPDDKTIYTEFRLLSRMSALEFVQKINNYLSYLLEKLEAISAEVEVMTDVTEFSEGEVILQCLELLLQALDKLLSWPDLKSPDNQEILKQLLDKIAARMRIDVVPSQKHSLQSLANEVFFYLNKFAEKAPSARIAILLHRLLSKIISITPDPKALVLQSGILAQKFLQTEWADMKNIKSDDIIYLLGQKISRSSSSVEVISGYISTVLPAIEQRDDEVLKNHPFLNKDTYVVYYKALSIELVSILDQFQEKDYDHDAAIAHIAEIVICWQNLTTSVKGNEKRSLLSAVLKCGLAFVNRFTKSTMPFLGGHFKTHRNSVIAILKNLQHATRTLQIICAHVKNTKDTSLAPLVPKLRKSLETIIFRVKAMLSDNNCPPDAFFLGALKHRDIRGEEVSSQMPIDTSEDESVDQLDELESDEEYKTVVGKATKKRKPSRRPKNDEDEEENDGRQRAKKSRLSKPAKSAAQRKEPKNQDHSIAADGRKLSNSQIGSSDIEEDEPEADRDQGREEEDEEEDVGKENEYNAQEVEEMDEVELEPEDEDELEPEPEPEPEPEDEDELEPELEDEDVGQ